MAVSGARWPDNVVRKEKLEEACPDLRVVFAGNGRDWIAAWLRPDGTEASAIAGDLGRLLDHVERELAAREADERLAAFAAAHPGAVADLGGFPPVVHIGGMPVTARTVAELLDKLDEIASIPGG